MLGDLIIGMPSVLEITVGHWPFSDQFEHLVDQNLPYFPYIFNGTALKQPLK